MKLSTSISTLEPGLPHWDSCDPNLSTRPFRPTGPVPGLPGRDPRFEADGLDLPGGSTFQAFARSANDGVDGVRPSALPTTEPASEPLYELIPTLGQLAVGILLGAVFEPVQNAVKGVAQTVNNLLYDPTRRPVPANTTQPTQGASGNGGNGAGGAGGSAK